MRLIDVIVENYVLIYELIGILFLLGISIHISSRVQRLNRIIVILLFLETIVFYIERWTQTLDHLSILRPLMTATLYSLYPIILVVLIQIISFNSLSKKKLLLLMIPEFVCVPIFYTSQWTHIVFYFHESNHWASSDYSIVLRYLTIYFICFLCSCLYRLQFLIFQKIIKNHSLEYGLHLCCSNSWGYIILSC